MEDRDTRTLHAQCTREQYEELEDWRRGQKPIPSMSAAIRIMIDRALRELTPDGRPPA